MNEDNWIMEAAEHENGADVSAGSTSVKQILTGLCYKEVNQGVWMKPFGKTLQTYEEKINTWTCHFKGLDEKMHRWDSAVYDKRLYENFHGFIANQEAYTRTDVGQFSDFFVMTREEYFNSIL
jgi:glutathionyl-hydroquinone reductase